MIRDRPGPWFDPICRSSYDSLTPALSYFTLGMLGIGQWRTLRKPKQRDLFRGALEMMILQSLRRQPMHGYALGPAHPAALERFAAGGGGIALSRAAAHVERKAGQGGVGDLAQQAPGSHLPDHSRGPAASGAGDFQLRADAYRDQPCSFSCRILGVRYELVHATLPARQDLRRSG